MALLDWSMSLVGYPPHRLSGVAVVGISHTPCHDALRLAQSCGFERGWLWADGPQPHFVDLSIDQPQWVQLDELFRQQRIAMTEGLVGGTVSFVAAAEGVEPPPAGDDVRAWAERQGQPWLLMIDNEFCRWGGLTDAHTDRLLAWFVGNRPLPVACRRWSFAASVAEQLRVGLFDHGWTRNGELVSDGRRPTVQLWGGVHGRSILDHDGTRQLSLVQRGVRLIADAAAARWQLQRLPEDCPLDDETGRLARRLET